MIIVQLNAVDYGSTDKIARQLCDVGRKNGDLSYFAHGWTKRTKKRNYKDDIIIGSRLSKSLHVLIGRILGMDGILSYFATKAFIRKLNKIRPDIVHIHILHSWYINYKILFKYLNKKKMNVVWTLHDCWLITGRCPHFVLMKCNKWIHGCDHCMYPRSLYPQAYIDSSKRMWDTKKKLVSSLNHLTIVTPSEWLAGLVKQSFLKDYPVKVINNGIDLNVFKPTESDFRKKYNIPEEKFILLGVAFDWGRRKGLDVFIELEKRLDSLKFQIVLVGTDDNVDKQLPSDIISIHRTQNQTELAEIYTAADLFVNPTREENYPTVNMESIACGTPVITFRTGGSPEILTEKTGMVVDCDDVEGLQHGIEKICEKNIFSTADCIEQAKQFDMNKRFQEYIELYNEFIEK